MQLMEFVTFYFSYVENVHSVCEWTQAKKLCFCLWHKNYRCRLRSKGSGIDIRHKW